MNGPEHEGRPTLLFAPIRGITTAAFRDAFARRFPGFDGALAPFVAPEGDRLPSDARLRDAFPALNPSMPTTPQVLTADPEAFVRVARAYLDAGCTCVNWNLGCPYPMVTRRKRGAGLLSHPDRIDAFLSEACGRLGPVVSVKLRLGMRDAAEAEPVLEVLNRYPLSEVVVHPRTAAQMYGGTVDLEAFARCLRASRHPLTYNGDIVDIGSFQARRAAFPTVQRWMIGRAAIATPWLIPALASGASSAAVDRGGLRGLHDALLAHHRATLSGPAHVLNKLKELWGYWAASFDPKSKPLKKLMRSKALDRYEDHVRELLWAP